MLKRYFYAANGAFIEHFEEQENKGFRVEESEFQPPIAPSPALIVPSPAPMDLMLNIAPALSPGSRLAPALSPGSRLAPALSPGSRLAPALSPGSRLAPALSPGSMQRQ